MTHFELSLPKIQNAQIRLLYFHELLGKNMAVKEINIEKLRGLSSE